MPLTATGQEVMSSMAKTYGPEKAKNVFYASINARKPGSSKWHGASGSSRRASRSSSGRSRSR